MCYAYKIYSYNPSFLKIPEIQDESLGPLHLEWDSSRRETHLMPSTAAAATATAAELDRRPINRLYVCDSRAGRTSSW